MIRLLRRIWDLTPTDVAKILIVAAAMPVFFMAYQVAGTLTEARVVFTVSVGILGIGVGYLIEDDKRPILGYLIGSISIAGFIAALISLGALADPTWIWRTVMAGVQANIVVAWFVLWRMKERWLARTVAFWAAAIAAAGFVLYLLANFGLPDPITLNPLNWALTEPRGIIARTLDYPLEPMLALILWTVLILKLRRYLLRHGPRHGS